MNAAAAAEVLSAEPMTLETWANMDEDLPGEFVDGQLVEEEVGSNRHEIVVNWIAGALRDWARARGMLVLASEHKLGISPTRGRKPDVAVYARGSRLGPGSMSRTPPHLIVEVISPAARDIRRDRYEKRIEYAQFGVHYYWLVDMEGRFIDFLDLRPNPMWASPQSGSEGPVEVAGFEGLVLDLDDLWAEADAWTAGSADGETPGESDGG